MLVKSRSEVTPELLIGKVFTEIEGLCQDSEEVIFKVSDTEYFKMQHYQDCCESVYVEDVVGDINNLLNTPILGYEEKSKEDENADESGTFTFYTFRTIKGYVDIRWYGSSNGYYSESVDFEQFNIEEYDEAIFIPYEKVYYGFEKGYELCSKARKWREEGTRNYYYKRDEIVRLNLGIDK